MPNLTPDSLARLEAHRLEGIETGPLTLHPYYEGYSLANIAGAVCHWLGIPAFGGEPLAREILSASPGPFRQVILLLVDGLGLNKLNQFRQAGDQGVSRFGLWERLVEAGTLLSLTSVVPSTTATALTSLWTGRTPAEHGVMGYEMWLKEYSLSANMILHSPASFRGEPGSLQRAGFDTAAFLPVPTLGPHLAAHGIQGHAFQHASIAFSGLSAMLFPMIDVYPFRTTSDLWATLPGHLKAHARKRAFTYIYWDDLDELSHHFGPNDVRVDLEFGNFTALVSYFMDALKDSRGETLLLMTADHGHMDTPKSPHFELRSHPQLVDCLHMLPTGESRFAYLHIKPGREQQIREYLERVFPGQFVMAPSEAVRSSGLLGSGRMHPGLADRTGDFTLIAQDGAYLWWANKENHLLGRHGGLSSIEMQIPLLGLVI